MHCMARSRDGSMDLDGRWPGGAIWALLPVKCNDSRMTLKHARRREAAGRIEYMLRLALWAAPSGAGPHHGPAAAARCQPAPGAAAPSTRGAPPAAERWAVAGQQQGPEGDRR
jgi:hypothetical protein